MATRVVASAARNGKPSQSIHLHEPDAAAMPAIKHDVPPPETVSKGRGEIAARLDWLEEEAPAVNYAALGQRLAASGDVYRVPEYGAGLLMLLPDGKPVAIVKGAHLSPVIADRIVVTVWKDGKPKGGRIATAHLDAMLRSRAFCDKFLAVDRITADPLYLADFSITTPGYNDGGPGHRVLYVGEQASISDSLEFTQVFLDEMAFATAADRTNAVAANLTVALRNHWPGGKPIILTTATKSQAGKDTVILYASGAARQTSISYQATNWALERAFVGAVGHDPDVGVVVIENARLDRRDRCIASAFIERFATDPEPVLFSTGTGSPVRRRNDIVLAISTNFGAVSEDIANRSLPIHLNPVGNVADRKPKFGNPKLEYLPQHRQRIAAETRGMIERWKAAGMPFDEEARHPFSVWAKTIGGILKVNGFQDFLANYGRRRTADDPLREALGLLGAKHFATGDDGWARPDEWARRTVILGLTKRVIPPGDQDSEEGRKRGIGVVMSALLKETFVVQTEAEEELTLCLERRRSRSGEAQPCTWYRFVLLERRAL